jgi:glycosyltransferase involved in cell wall biosynthesis
MEEVVVRDNGVSGDAEVRSSRAISVVVPVYNSASILPALIQRLEAVLSSLAYEYEVVLVNDGSRDQSWSVILGLSHSYPWVRGINLMRNYGQHNALLCGIRAARFEILVTMDDDLQHPPEEIPKLLSKCCEGYDVVYGASESRRQGPWRELTSRATRLVLRHAMNIENATEVSPFRVLRVQACKPLTNCEGPFVSVDVVLSWGTNRFGSVATVQNARHSGKSNYTFKALVTHALTMMTGFSTWPLRLASVVGFVFTFFGLIVLVYVVGRYFVEGDSVPGFPFLASQIAIFSGAQLFALGMIGEYLARMYFRSMERPAYVVRQTTDEPKRAFACRDRV